ncbi:hypothetical protein Hypma_002534 [Hypsizygus marmoreus]|uniref:Uncharacterized protein n=1 Tax=Hypsizygus marmoreus TaxID=39966 RepID=A0A369J6A5_HYPMA|nr:hypothetical protein Hypma_002534 [Hypsizygus marmoreus]
MKYSQAILLACVGGAAIVSAISTLAGGDAELSARNPSQSTVPRKSRSTKIGSRLGKLIKYGGTFAQQANPNRVNQMDETEYYPRSIFSSLAKIASKPKVRKSASSLKRAGKAAVSAAGGGQAVASSLGAVAGMAMGRNSDQSAVYRRDLPEELPSSETSPSSATPNPQAIVGNGGKKGGLRDKAARRKKWQRISADAKAKFKAERKAKKLANHGKAVAAEPSAEGVPSVPSPIDSSVATRAFDELDIRELFFMVNNLQSREFQELLETRGIRDAWRALKATLGGKKPSNPSFNSPTEQPLVERDFDFDALAERDVDSELETRHFEIDMLD